MMDDLPPVSPSQARSERVVARCHERLARQRRRLDRRRVGTVERSVTAGFALIYFVAVAIRALSVFSAF